MTPALAIAQLLPEAPVTVYADGLMSYGPTRNKIDPLIGGRVSRLLHLDLVPGLAPLLLGEFGAVPEAVPVEAFTKCVEELAGPSPARGPAAEEGPVLLLGQYLAALNLLTAAEEEELHLRMVRGAVALGHRRLVFKPHPTAPDAWSRALVRAAEELGAELTVEDRPVLAEVLYRELRPALVVGCFSTALLTARTFYGLPVARVGTRPSWSGSPLPEQQPDPAHGGGRGRPAARRPGGRRLRDRYGGAERPGRGGRLRDAAEDPAGAADGGGTAPVGAARRAHPAPLHPPPPHRPGPPRRPAPPRHPQVRRLARRALRLRRALKR